MSGVCYSLTNFNEVCNDRIQFTVNSRYLEVEGTLSTTLRYPYFDISDLQNWGKYISNNQISQINMEFDSLC